MQLAKGESTPQRGRKVVMNRLVITVGGGTRGIGLAILEEFRSHGCDIKAYHCRRDRSCPGKNYFFDANQEESLEETKASIMKEIEANRIHKEVIIVFLTGGGNPGLNEQESEETKTSRMKRIYRHNYDVPTEITDLILENSAKKENTNNIKLVFLSSAVALHKNANPHYCAAKSALETYFQATFKQKRSEVKMYLYRLGMVDVKHKYLHSLSVDSPDEFRELLEGTVPSNHFSKPEEVARIIRKTVLDSNTCNGIICDVSGGNSWQ